ncbi:TPA: hypothetical protein ACGW65_001153 [Bacillus paranthracis]
MVISMQYIVLTPKKKMNFSNITYRPSDIKNISLWKQKTNDTFVLRSEGGCGNIERSFDDGSKQHYFSPTKEQAFLITKNLMNAGFLEGIESNRSMSEDEQQELNELIFSYNMHVLEKKNYERQKIRIQDLMLYYFVEEKHSISSLYLCLLWNNERISISLNLESLFIHVMAPSLSASDKDKIAFIIYDSIFEGLTENSVEWEKVCIKEKHATPHPLKQASELFNILIEHSGAIAKEELHLSEKEYENLKREIEVELDKYTNKTIFI